MLSSIVHRITGVGLYLGAIVLTAWLAAAAAGPETYAAVEGVLLSFLGRLVLFGFTLAAVFHLANGVRHLVWDAGAGFAPKAASRASIFILLFTVVATLLVWAAAYWL
jgi:succinate dehydrogenase / fumarate reductase cytochrome b subunit